MANIVEKTMPHVEAMEPGAILDRVDDVEKLDKVARRTFSISDDDAHGTNVLGEHRDFGRIEPPRQSFAISRCNQKLNQLAADRGPAIYGRKVCRCLVF